MESINISGTILYYMKPNRKKNLKRSAGILSVIAICFMLAVIPGSVLSAPGVIGDNYFVFNDSFYTNDDWSYWDVKQYATLNAPNSYVDIDNGGGIGMNITDDYLSNYTFYIRFMITGIKIGHVNLFSINNVDEYGISSGFLSSFAIQLSKIDADTVNLAASYYSENVNLDINKWYELTMTVWNDETIDIDVFDMSNVIMDGSNTTVSHSGLKTPDEMGGQVWYWCGNWYYPGQDTSKIRVDAVRMWYDDPAEEANPLPGDSDPTLGNSILNLVYFLPIMVLTWSIGKAGFILGSGFMAIVWMFTQVDFIWEGIVMLGITGIYVMKEGI